MIIHLAVSLILLFHTWTDLKEQIIFVPAALLGLLSGVGYALFMGMAAVEMFVRMFAGLFILAAALAGRAIGAGDGWAVLSVCLFMDVYRQIIWLMAAFLLAAAAAFLIFILRRGRMKKEMVLAPFLLGAYLGGWYGGIL